MRAEKTVSPLSRSNLVRQRRQQRSTQRVSQTREAASRAARAPSVIVRGDPHSAARPIHQTNRSRVKRQYYYSLGASGAELRLPALPMINLGWRIISAIIAVFMALAIFALGFSAEFQVSDITVEGISRLTVGDIEAVLSARGSQIVTFDSPAAKADLVRAFPELESVKIQVGLPAKITVKVTELQPVVAWTAGENVYWIAENGVILPPRGEPGELLTVGADTQPPLLPLADADRGPTLTEASETADTTVSAVPVEIWGRQIDPNTMKRMIDLTSLIPVESKLVYNSLNGLGWEEPSGLDVYIGRDLGDFDLKVSMYQAIIANLDQRGIKPQDMISVEFINAPFFR
ncbi:MAG: cell division protein FtsQ/DivIB [Bellilinea sp.]